MVKVWSLNTPDSKANINVNSPVCSVQFRPNSATQLAAACVDNTVQVHNDTLTHAIKLIFKKPALIQACKVFIVEA